MQGVTQFGREGAMSTLLMIGLWVMLSTCQTLVTVQEAATQRPAFRLVHAKNVDILQQELDRASAEGYAVSLAWPGYDLVVLRRRSATELLGAYRVLKGNENIAQSLLQGYRALPDTLEVTGGTLLVIAQPPGEGVRYESLILRTSGTSALDREIRDARAKGFHVVGMASDDSGHAAVLERRGGEMAEPGGADAVALIAASRQDTLQKELADRSAAGYRIAQASSWTETVLALEQRDGDTPLEYLVLSTTRGSTLEREMNGAAVKGFRLTPGTLHAQQKGAVPIFGGRMGTEYVAIMEKCTDTHSVAGYVIVGARRIGTLTREFDAAVAKGLVPVAMTLGYSDQEMLVVLERPRQ
jgi:hypothetical protein